MKKVLGLICGLTVLSSCSWFAEEKTLASDSRYSPLLNDGSSASLNYLPPTPMADPMAMGMDRSMPPMAGMGAGGMPMPPEPPAFRNDPINSTRPPMVSSAPLTPPPLPGQQSFEAPVLVGSASDNNPLNAVSSAMPVPPAPPVMGNMPQTSAALPTERRMPEFNRTALSAGEVSGDVVASVPPAPVAQMPMPPAPVNEYPKLAQVPPAPPAPASINTDQRVAAMRNDLASMEQNMPVPPAPPAMPAPKIVVSEVRSSVTPIIPPAPIAALPPQRPPMPVTAPPAPRYAPQPAPVATTSLNDLRPLPPMVSKVEAAPVAMMPAADPYTGSTPYTSVENLTPIAGTGQLKTLPDSRYARTRTAARNGYATSIR